MTKHILTYILGLVIHFSAIGQLYNINVKIEGLKSDKGKVMVQLMTQENNELISVKNKTIGIENMTATLVFENMDSGDYGIRYFHDENSNQELDTNWIGIPTETYGFSNNAMGTFGPPDFDDWRFSLNKELDLIMRLD